MKDVSTEKRKKQSFYTVIFHLLFWLQDQMTGMEAYKLLYKVYGKLISVICIL